LQPLTSQINKMSGKSVAVATGLGAAATLMMAENADAATELAQLAGVDNRIGIIGGLFLPALGWVAFNALGVSACLHACPNCLFQHLPVVDYRVHCQRRRLPV
jgi:hypothetical protein